MQRNRKTATKLLIVQWSRFQKICVNLEGSVLFTGVNGSGKSTILDAVTYLLTGNTQFNKAAKDRDRNVLAYVRGDTRSNGSARYLRNGEVVSYIAMEFWSPVENCFLVVGVCVESANEASAKSSWFVCRDAKIGQINFTRTEGKLLRISPRNELSVNGRAMKSADFLGRDRGVEQILRALGLRCDAGKYRSKLLKMMAFNPENNIDQFIQECVLEPGKVESLKELREQKLKFEELKGLFENYRKSKDSLKEVERISLKYEDKLKQMHIRELMLCYQELREKEEEKDRISLEIKKLAQALEVLEGRKRAVDQRHKDAGERYRIAMNNDMFRGMQESLNELKRQQESLTEEIRRQEESLSMLKKLQIQITEALPWLMQFLDISKEDQKRLSHMSENEFQTEAIVDAFVRLGEVVSRQDKIFETDEVHLGDHMKQLEHEIGELEKKIKRLKANCMVFPKEAEEAKRIIQSELELEGIHTEVKIFAELVQEVSDAKWRAAIETFLGRKRFFIIVDGSYCHKAMEILQRKKLYAANVVITDRLPDTQAALGSAAEILTIPNVYARRYANYLLNGIHLCETLEELHECPKGGLMPNGMLAKSYSVSYMNLGRTEYCLGQDAMRYQLENAERQKQEKLLERGSLQSQRERVLGWRKELRQIDWKAEHYDFRAASALKEAMEQRKRIGRDIEKISRNDDFMAVLQEQKDAEAEYKKIESARDVLIGDIRGCEKDQQMRQEEQKKNAAEIYSRKQAYKEQCLLHMELKNQMLEEYERLREKTDRCQVVSPKTVRNLRGEVEECVRQLENAQLSYCKLAEIDIQKRGVSYIPFFRGEYRDLVNVKIEEARQRLEEQSLKLENAFMNDFVAEMNETIREAKEEIASINRELKSLPFGDDTYKFVMKEKADRDVFFKICKKLEQYMGMPDVYMNSAREDEEMEREIRRFMEVIMEEEDETEYTDYRKYFVYDMEIVSRQGDSEITADLSKKQGSASNGEKQTPYFIILAASLLQCYPRQACCARLAFIDEAFSALSRERIEQMVKYLEENHFQVFYAAPPDKINSIGSYINSTISLAAKGRYTNAIEGLVKDHAAYA